MHDYQLLFFVGQLSVHQIIPCIITCINFISIARTTVQFVIHHLVALNASYIEAFHDSLKFLPVAWTNTILKTCMFQDVNQLNINISACSFYAVSLEDVDFNACSLKWG